MEDSNIVCPVCSLFLREGITLKSHLGTHPKEKVIEALLRATSKPDGESSTPPVQTYLPAPTPASSYVSPGPQYVNPPSQMTAVTYQHFMTSSGSAVLPQYIQVPTIVTPNPSVPLLPQQSFTYVPSPSGSYPQTLYNPLYNPYIPQPYPMTQQVITSFPVTDVQNSEVGNHSASHISVISNTNVSVSPTVNISTDSKDSTEKCTIATNTMSSVVEEMDLSDCKTEDSLSEPPSPTFEITRNLPSSRSVKVAHQSKSTAISNEVSVLTVSKVSSKTSVIRTSNPSVKIIPSEKSFSSNSSTSSIASSSSGIVSPPPLTRGIVERSRSSSASCPQTPPPLPALTPGHWIQDDTVSIKNESNTRETEILLPKEDSISSLSKVQDYLAKHERSSSVNSVIVEATFECSKTSESYETVSQNRKQVIHLDSHNKSFQIGSNNETAKLMRGLMKSVNNDELQVEICKSVSYPRDLTKVIDIPKETILCRLTSNDIPKEISSANIERNCDGSDIFIQEENIPFTEQQQQEEKRKESTNEIKENKIEAEGFDMYSGNGEEGDAEDNQASDLMNDVPKYTDLQPATYTDLQPASGPQVLHEMGLSTPINFNNFMEIDGIRIFFSNNPPNNVPLAPTIKFTSKDVDRSVDSVHDYYSKDVTESKDFSLDLVNSKDGPEDLTTQEGQMATTSAVKYNSSSPLTLNIQADESMPARGELSEQESLGADNSNWAIYRGEEGTDWKPRVTGLQNQPIITVQPIRKSFKCSLCNEKFTCPKERRVHKNTIHMIQTPRAKELSRKSKAFKCIHCDVIFSCIRERRIHVMNRHSSEERIRKNFISQTIKKEAGETSDRFFTSEKTICETDVIKNEGGSSVKLESSSTEQAMVSLPPSVSLPRKCPKCSKMFLSVRKLREHLREIHGDIKFQCGTCSICFDEETDFNAHLKIHPLVCNQCGKMFYRKPNLNLHLKRHLEVKPYECTLCPKSFITRQKLDEHMNGHSGNKPIKCNLCDRTFSRHSNLIQHRNMHHLKVKRKIKDHVCRCGEVFHSIRKLEWHKEVHDAKPKTCPYCAQKFIHAASVTRHVRRAHMPEYLPGDNREYENVTCPICERVYLRSSLMVHMRVHNGDKPFVCQICSKRFSTKWNLELHSWTHQSRSNMPYKCSTCKSAFFRESDYIAHMNSHKNFKPFTCNICGQKFIRKYNCLRHQEEHKKAKRFVCTVSGCDKSFHRSYYLKDHMKVHTGIRPHTCHVCGKASSTKSNHNKHVRIHDTREPINTEN